MNKQLFANKFTASVVWAHTHAHKDVNESSLIFYSNRISCLKDFFLPFGWTAPLWIKVDSSVLWFTCGGARTVSTGSDTHARVHVHTHTNTHTQSDTELKLSGGAESELSKERNVMGGQLVFCHVIFPYAVKAEQMSPSIGRGRPGGLRDTVWDRWRCEEPHN